MTTNVKKVQITQIILSNACVRRDKYGLIGVTGEAINKQIATALNCAEKHGVDLLIFPELTIPNEQKWRNKFKKWSRENEIVVVGGSYYATKRSGDSIKVTPTSPVYVSGEEILVPKSCISPFEDPQRKDVQFDHLNNGLRIIPNTPAGTLGVAICSDVFDSKIQQEIKENADLDILCVPAMQRDPGTHLRSLSEMCRHAKDGIFVAYANSLWAKHSGGGSSILGLLHRNYQQRIRDLKMSEPTKYEEHLIQMPDCGRNLIFSIDLSMRRPVQANLVTDTSPVKIVYGDYKPVPESDRFTPVHGKKTSPKINIVAFDADGTLIKGLKFSWQLLWTSLYGEESDRLRENLREAYKMNVTKDPDNRQRYYEEWCGQCCKKFKEKKLKRDQILSLCNGLYPADNLVPALQHIKRNLKCRLVLVSGGLDVIAKAVLGKEAWELFDSRYINVMSFTDDGYLNHIEPTQFDFEGKYDALLQEALSINCLPANVAFVGDEHNDRAALSRIHLEGGLAIAFGPHTGLSQEEVSTVINTNDLSSIPPAIVSHNSKINTSVRESIDKGLRKRYTSDFPEKDTGFREVYSILQNWVSVIGIQLQTSWMGKVKHDNGHRQRVLRTVGRLILPSVYASRHPQHLAFLADCAVAVHDIGLQLPIELYIPGADVYPSEFRSRLSQRRHHNLASNVLRQISEGNYTNDLSAAIEKTRIKRSLEPKALAILKDTCHILGQINVFHDANEGDLFGVHAELRAVLSETKWFKASPEDVSYLGAVIRLADRLDRHHKRFRNAREAEQLCSHWAMHGVDASIPGVVIDSAVVGDCKVEGSRHGLLSVHYRLPNFKDPQALDYAHFVFEERVLPRIREKRPWYVRQIEKQVSVNVADPILSRSDALELRRSRPRVRGDFAIENHYPLTAVIAEVLACTPVDSWLRSVIGRNMLFGGSEHIRPGNSDDFLSPELVFDIAQWGIVDLSKPTCVLSKQNLCSYIGAGGSPSRLKGLAPSEPCEWDIYIPFSDKKDPDCRMLLNAHIPYRLGYSRDRAREYMNRLSQEVRPYTERLVATLMHQNEMAISLIKEVYGFDLVCEIERIRRGEDDLETIDLSSFAYEMSNGNARFSGLTVKTDQKRIPLFPDMPETILGTICSTAVLRALCIAVSEKLSMFGDFSVVAEEHTYMPVNSIKYITSVGDMVSAGERGQLDLFSKFCLSAELLIPEVAESAVSTDLRGLHALARLAGIGIKANFVGEQFEIILSFVSQSPTL